MNPRFIYGSLFLLFLGLLLPGKIYSQRKSDIGFFAGTSYYMGDLNPSRHFYIPSYAIGPIFRYNFEPRNSLRFHGIYHKLSGDPAGYGDPYVESFTGKAFTKSFIDLAANYEINFIPYKTANRKLNQSLYLTAGLGYHVSIAEFGKSHFTIPFGMGYKFNLTKKLSAGMEVTGRKTFADEKIDDVININPEEKNPLFGNKDWYTFAGIFISYKIFSFREDCPAYE